MCHVRIEQALRETLQHMFLFEQLTSKDLDIVVDTMVRRDVKAGEVLIKQGDFGDAFYVVGEGRFDILIDGVGKVAERAAGSFFGELALLCVTSSRL